ncbi:MAG: YqaA family protein [bacterium]
MAGKNESRGFFLTRWVRALYNWVLHWAESPHAEKMLGVLSFAESSFFPIPPDVLLIPMGVSRPDRALRFGAITSVTSVLGGIVGYLIGFLFFDTVGIEIIKFYGVMDKYWQFREWFDQYNFIIIMFAGLTPLPYKVFTITAGVAAVNFPVFLLGSILSRSTRFMAEGVVCYYGDFFSQRVFKMPIRDALDRYINWFGLAMAALGVAGFLVIKVVLPGAEVDICKDLGPEEQGRACFWSVEPENQEGSFMYHVSLSREGSTVDKVRLDKAYPKPSRGHASLSEVKLASGESLLAAVFYHDLPGEENLGTDGTLLLYQVGKDGLRLAHSRSFPRYRLGENGAWQEGKIKVENDEKGIRITRTIVHHAAGGGPDRKEHSITTYELRQGRLLETGSETPGSR